MEMVALTFAVGVCYENTAFQYSSWGLGDQNGWQSKVWRPSTNRLTFQTSWAKGTRSGCARLASSRKKTNLFMRQDKEASMTTCISAFIAWAYGLLSNLKHYWCSEETVGPLYCSVEEEIRRCWRDILEMMWLAAIMTKKRCYLAASLCFSLLGKHLLIPKVLSIRVPAVWRVQHVICFKRLLHGEKKHFSGVRTAPVAGAPWVSMCSSTSTAVGVSYLVISMACCGQCIGVSQHAPVPFFSL